LTTSAGYYSTTKGSFPTIGMCSTPFADVKFYAGTQTGSTYGPTGTGINDPPPDGTFNRTKPGAACDAIDIGAGPKRN
jgi:hypothetical protein